MRLLIRLLPFFFNNLIAQYALSTYKIKILVIHSMFCFVNNYKTENIAYFREFICSQIMKILWFRLDIFFMFSLETEL